MPTGRVVMFGYRINLFRIFGVPIRIDLSWFLIVLLIAWSLAEGLYPFLYPDAGLTAAMRWAMGVGSALGLFASILLHELAHAVVAMRYGIGMQGITLFIFGGVAEMTNEPPSPRAEFSVAIAGPAMSVAVGLGLLLIGAAPWPLPVAGVVGWLAVINLILVAFNMVPAFPLDGGRVLRSILWQWKGNLRWATRITSRIGGGFGMALMVLAVVQLFFGAFIAAIWWFLIGMFLRNAAQMSYQQVLIRQMLQGEPVRRFMQSDVVTVDPDLPLDRFVDELVYRHHYKVYPAVVNERFVGCVSTNQLGQFPRDQWDQHTVGELMQPCSPANTIRPDADAVDALEQMSRTEQSRLMVVSNGHLEGIIALRDLMAFLSLKLELEEGQPQADRWDNP